VLLLQNYYIIVVFNMQHQKMGMRDFYKNNTYCEH